MREWQVGDPVGDGNDIGVPDTRYLDYLKNRDGESSGNLVDEFKSGYSNSMDFFKLHHEEDAFMMLEYAFRIYMKMDDNQKSQVSYNPFNRDWAIELCCNTINRHDKRMQSAINIIVQNRYSARMCRGCDLVYPYYHECCPECGKPLEDITGKTPEEIGEQLSRELKTVIFDEARRQKIVVESVKLMKSNGCELVRFQRGMGLDIDFVFVKGHRFFTTTYLCAYNPEYVGPLAFEEFETRHDHNDLLVDGRFRKLVRDTERETGFKFRECIGGYGAKLDYTGYGFTFTDEIKITVRFNMGDGRTAAYGLDLKNMKFEKEYMVFE